MLALHRIEGSKAPARLRRLREFHDFYAYMERRFPELIDEWLQQRPS